MNLLKPKILRYESLPSTNNEAARLAALGAEEGLTVVAEEQTAGRGRLQRIWVSPKGAGLYVSILLLPKIPQDRWPLITFMASLSVSDALLQSCDLKTDIKWPNDLLAGERKICGILAEVIETERGRGIVLGIGINLTSEAFPVGLASAAISVAEATGRRPEREKVLAALIAALSNWYALLNENGGDEKIVAAWKTQSSYAEGKLVRVVNGDEMITGVTRGLETDGALRLETDRGELVTVRAGDVVSVRATGNQ
jgi:BirA family transcriptional regulator, biotin operon repressor / biotin---[acetyl-CoA-carboxylase] ligase